MTVENIAVPFRSVPFPTLCFHVSVLRQNTCAPETNVTHKPRGVNHVWKGCHFGFGFMTGFSPGKYRTLQGLGISAGASVRPESRSGAVEEAIFNRGIPDLSLQEGAPGDLVAAQTVTCSWFLD